MLKKGVKAEISRIMFEHLKQRYTKNGDIKEFDDEFYAQFDDMFYIGIPVYYYLQTMHMGRCFDASAVLGLAMGDGCYICRGELKNLSKFYKEPFVYGWVEKDGYVYDTTWQIICKKEIYQKVFNPVDVERRTHSKFFDDCKGLSDWTIRNKEWYENNYSTANLIIFQIRALEREKLENSHISEEDRLFSEKVLRDLPVCSIEMPKEYMYKKV